MSRASSVIFFMFLVPACAGGPSRGIGSAPADLTRELLIDLRPQVKAALQAAPEGGLDRWPLLRKAGRLQLSESDKSSEDGAEWVLDGWGHPVVLFQSSGDWCLLSAGPDGVWTADRLQARTRYENDRKDFAASAPGGDEEQGPWVLGDDIGLRGSGAFLERYPFAVPEAKDVVDALSSTLKGKAQSSIKISEGIARDLMNLLPEAEAKIVAFFKKHGEFPLEEVKEDDHGRPTNRLLLPIFQLSIDRTGKRRPLGVRIVPTALGWYLSWDLPRLLRAADPPPPVTFFGHDLDLDEDGFFFLIEIPASMADEGRRQLKRDLIRFISGLPERCDFSIAVLRGSLRKFTGSGRPASATESMKRSAVEFVERMDAEDAAASASDLEQALLASMTFAVQSATYPKAIVLVGSGEVTNPLRVIVELTSRNTQHVEIHSLGIGIQPGSAEERFLQKLSGQNYGTYARISP